MLLLCRVHSPLPVLPDICPALQIADKLKAGIDKIACMAVNDAHVMRAWAEANDAVGIIDMIADFHTELSDAWGLHAIWGQFWDAGPPVAPW